MDAVASGSDDPALRVQWHGPDTVVLRQGKSVHAEAPFLFLLLGTERALLLDTGAETDPEDFPLRATVDHLVDTWLERHEMTGRYPLVVAHSHPHDDHVAGDRQLADRPDTTIVGHDAAAVAACFGPDGWSFDLGGRPLEVLATPGHHPAAITIFDPATAAAARSGSAGGRSRRRARSDRFAGAACVRRLRDRQPHRMIRRARASTGADQFQTGTLPSA